MILTKKLSEYNRSELDSLGVILGLDPSDYGNKDLMLASIQDQASKAGILLGPAEPPVVDLDELLQESVQTFYQGDRRKSGTQDNPKVYVVDGIAYLYFGRPERDHKWTDANDEEHVAKAKDQRTGFAVPLGQVVLMNVPESRELPHPESE